MVANFDVNSSSNLCFILWLKNGFYCSLHFCWVPGCFWKQHWISDHKDPNYCLPFKNCLGALLENETFEITLSQTLQSWHPNCCCWNSLFVSVCFLHYISTHAIRTGCTFIISITFDTKHSTLFKTNYFFFHLMPCFLQLRSKKYECN